MKSFTLSNGQSYTRSIDQDGRIASITPMSGPVRSFAFDPNGSTVNDGLNSYCGFRSKLAMDIRQRIKEQVTGHPVVLYMKGTPQLPQCGFSALA